MTKNLLGQGKDSEMMGSWSGKYLKTQHLQDKNELIKKGEFIMRSFLRR